MKTPKRITVAMLKRLNACEEGIEAFEEAFGKSAAISLPNIKKARAMRGLDYFAAWLANILFPCSMHGCICPLCCGDKGFDALSAGVKAASRSLKKKPKVRK